MKKYGRIMIIIFIVFFCIAMPKPVFAVNWDLVDKVQVINGTPLYEKATGDKIMKTRLGRDEIGLEAKKSYAVKGSSGTRIKVRVWIGVWYYTGYIDETKVESYELKKSNTSIGKIIEEYNANPKIINTMKEEKVEQWIKEIEDLNKLLMSNPQAAGAYDMDLINKIHVKLLDRRAELNKDKTQDQIQNNEEKQKEMKEYTPSEIQKWFTDGNSAEALPEDIKEKWRDTITNSGESQEFKDQVMNQIDGAGLEDTMNRGSHKWVYKQPTIVADDTPTKSLDDILTEGDSFIAQGEDTINQEKLPDYIGSIYNILLTIGIVLATVGATFLGIRFMLGSVEEKAEIKKFLIPYLVGCIIVFGSFGIWKLAVIIMQQF